MMSDHSSPTTTPKIPVSTGVPPFVLGLMFLSLVLIVALLYLVGATAHEGHVWPSLDSTKVPLSTMKSLKP